MTSEIQIKSDPNTLKFKAYYYHKSATDPLWVTREYTDPKDLKSDLQDMMRQISNLPIPIVNKG
jgi:hypothetical protein